MITGEEISQQLSSVSIDCATSEWTRINKMSDENLADLNGRSRIGCKFIDRYFFAERIATKGNKGICFIDFVNDYNTVYANKMYIQTLMRFCEKNGRYKNSMYGRLWYCYGLCFGRITPFKITNALALYREFRPLHIVDPFAGFGGRMAAAMLCNISYTGFDTNIYLRDGYERMISEFGSVDQTQTIKFKDSLSVDYTTPNFEYDMVLTSPPYENTEVYRHSPVRTREEWNRFYIHIFNATWKGLSSGGVYAINISSDIYKRILLPLLGEANEQRVLKKSSRNLYTEMIYIWKK